MAKTEALVVKSVDELMKNEEMTKIFFYVMEHKKEFEKFEKELRAAFVKEMEENGLEQMRNDRIIATYNAPHKSTKVDTKRLDKDGLLEMYQQEYMVSASVRFTLIK